MVVLMARVHQSVQQQDSHPLMRFFSVNGLYVLQCFDWFVSDRIIRIKRVQNHFFGGKKTKCTLTIVPVYLTSVVQTESTIYFPYSGRRIQKWRTRGKLFIFRIQGDEIISKSE